MPSEGEEMRKTFLAVALVSLAAAVPETSAQNASAPAKPEPPPTQPSATLNRSPRIAVIDMNRVSSESLLGKGYQTQLEQLKSEIDSEGTKKQSELNKLDTAIKALQDELEKQGSVLSPEAAEKKRQDIVKKTRERQAYLEDGQAELQRMRERAQQQAQNLNNEFQVKMKPHIDAVVKEKNIDILLTSDAAVFMSRDFDISRDVIVKSDDAERTAKSQKPAAPPKPNPPAPQNPPKQ
jgi:Skp family chaperone for outer membrane proteins